jgi:hypothetical protein
MELPIIEKLLEPLEFDVVFLSISVGDDPLRPCPEAITVCRNSAHAEYTLGPTVWRSSIALSKTLI